MNNKTNSLSETCVTAKREIRSWLLALILIVCSPIVLINLLQFLPTLPFWILVIGLQFAALLLMWHKCNWNLLIKVSVMLIYIIMYVINLIF